MGQEQVEDAVGDEVADVLPESPVPGEGPVEQNHLTVRAPHDVVRPDVEVADRAGQRLHDRQQAFTVAVQAQQALAEFPREVVLDQSLGPRPIVVEQVPLGRA